MYGRQLLERRFPLLVLLCLLAGGVTAAIDQQQVGRVIVSVIGQPAMAPNCTRPAQSSVSVP